ncbi:substrate-binding domain-containing protein [Microbacterium gilvum]|uniref:Sugar ABC transporter substrate-binding protein n=1 Tax=Microbacterium gilvum TaxID=1336204 RepID=A0ABP9A0F0_9MICO
MSIKRIAAAALGAAALVIALAGCSGSGTAGTGEAGAGDAPAAAGDIKLCVYTHGDGGTFWSVVQKGAEDAAAAYGVTLDYQGSTNDSSRQASMIEAGISGGCDGIAASAPDPGAITDAMQAAADAGIPTVTVNSGSAVFADLGAFTHVGQDEIVAGREAGDQFDELGATKILCVVHEAANSGLLERCDGAAETFDGEVVELNADQALADLTAAEAKVRASLEADPGIDAVFAVNADVATGAALPAIAAVGRDIQVGTVDLSADALTAISSGDLAFAIDQQQYAQGHLAIELLFLAVTDAIELGGGLPMYTGPAFVTADNVDAVQASVDAGTR